MAEHDQDTVRRLLKAALNKLDGELHGGKEISNSILFSESEAGAPVILVVVGGLNSQGEDAPSVVVAVPDGGREIGKAPASIIEKEAQAPHPGLERFALAETDSLPAAPKACFMEPGRTCVSSGACEMRGF